MSRNSQKSYSEHFLQTEAFWLWWDESFREHTFTPLGNKDFFPKIYNCQGRKTLPVSAKYIFQRQLFLFTRKYFKTLMWSKWWECYLNPVSLFSQMEDNVLEICFLQCCYTVLCDINRTYADDNFCSNVERWHVETFCGSSITKMLHELILHFITLLID